MASYAGKKKRDLFRGHAVSSARLWVYGLDCPFWLGGERNLAQAVGRPDPVAALTLIPPILREGWQAVHASRLGCGCC